MARTTDDRSASVRLALSATADKMAGQADVVADILERAAARGDAGRRLDVARWERETAQIHRRNAARLRSATGGGLSLEHLPSLSEFRSAPATRRPPAEDDPPEG